MRTPRPLLLLACLVVPVALSAQESASPPSSASPTTSDPQAVALVDRSLVALTGGVAIADVTLTGSAHRIAGSDDESGSVTVEGTSVGDSRVTLSLSSGNQVELRNHSALPLSSSFSSSVPSSIAQQPQPVGAWSGPDGVLRPIAANNLLTDPNWFFPAFTLRNLVSSGAYVFSYVGQEALDGQTVLHISAVRQFPTLVDPELATLLQHMSQMDFFLDPATLLPVALTFSNHPADNAFVDIAMEVRFSNYTARDGVEVPFEVQKYINGGLTLDLNFDAATFNSGLISAQFQLQ